MTLLEEIQGGENAALEFKEAKRCDENLVKKHRIYFVSEYETFARRDR